MAESNRGSAPVAGIVSVNVLDAAVSLAEKGHWQTAILRILEYLQQSELRTLAPGWKYSEGVLTVGMLKAGLIVDSMYEGTPQIARMVGISEGLAIKLLVVWERLSEEVFKDWLKQTEPLPFIDVYAIACLPQVEQPKAWVDACRDYQAPVRLTNQ